MTTVTYAPSSPYFGTPQTSQYLQYLDYWKGAIVVPSISDTLYEVVSTYHHRPDLLSHDIYGTTGYWWIFALRNPDIIQDPIYDLKTGITIYIPNKNNLPTRSAA